MNEKKGTRSRDGCFNCRKRKRRCDKQKPICVSCSKSSSRCVYPSAATPLKFVISLSPGHYTIPIAQEDGKTPFLNLTSHDVATIRPALDDLESDHIDIHLSPPDSGYGEDSEDSRSDLHVESPTQLTLPRPMSLNLPVSNGPLESTETALLQYYVEVVSSSRVYVRTNRNLFLHSVLPRILDGQGGPLLYTALAMSAAEWGHNVMMDGRNYQALSTRYKVRALEQLQLRLWTSQNAEENLLTCVLLASLDISQGSRSTWLRHLQGALALLEDFSDKVDPAVASLALQYFRFRCILLRTTQPKSCPKAADALGDDEAHLCHASYRLFDRVPVPEGYEPSNMIDEHMGCSTELLDIIDKISALSLTDGKINGPTQPREPLHVEGHRLEQMINKISATTLEVDDRYLLRSAEAFRLATQIYLQLACFNATISDQSIVTAHKDLMDCLSTIIVEGQPRRSFPMWPMFIAGCTCSTDEQRKAVIHKFSILGSQWPISNVPAIWKALRTIWQARDLSAAAPATKQQDWQEIIHHFRWKLSLS